jgi:hypothetical protein
MPGKRAKVLAAADVGDLLVFASCTRHPLRNTVMSKHRDSPYRSGRSPH